MTVIGRPPCRRESSKKLSRPAGVDVTRTCDVIAKARAGNSCRDRATFLTGSEFVPCFRAQRQHCRGSHEEEGLGGSGTGPPNSMMTGHTIERRPIAAAM